MGNGTEMVRPLSKNAREKDSIISAGTKIKHRDWISVDTVCIFALTLPENPGINISLRTCHLRIYLQIILLAWYENGLRTDGS